MLPACGEIPVKLACGPNATPIPRLASRFLMFAAELKLTLGRATPVLALPEPEEPSLEISAAAAAAGRSGQPAGPGPEAGEGSSAIMATRPPWYGSETAVQPSPVAEAKYPPCR